MRIGNDGCKGGGNKYFSCLPTGRRVVPFTERENIDSGPDFVVFEINVERACHDDWLRKHSINGSYCGMEQN